MFIKKLVSGMNSVNTYLAGDEDGKIAIIDPGTENTDIINLIDDFDLKPDKIINTHCHFDHIGGNEFLKKKYDLKIAIHKAEKDFLNDPAKNLSKLLGNEVISPEAEIFLEEGNIINLGSNKFKVIHTPGHSPGGIALYNENEKVLFSGDTIFKTGVGRFDFSSSDKKKLKNSIKKLLKLNDDVKVYPGHGRETTIGDFKNIWSQMKI